ncbi:MAG: hypothetical protein R6U61_07355 [Thermoplasmata archaeon]
MRKTSDRCSSKEEDSGDKRYAQYNDDETLDEDYLEYRYNKEHNRNITRIRNLLIGTFWVSMVMILWMFSIYAIHMFWNPLNESGGLFSVSVLGIASVFTFRSAMTPT